MYRLYLQEGCVDHIQDVTLVCHACLYVQNKWILLLLKVLRSAETINFFSCIIPRLNHTLFNVKKPVCVFIRYAHGGLKFFTEAAALVPSNMPRRVGWGLAFTVQNEIVVQNFILNSFQLNFIVKFSWKLFKMKTVTKKMHQNLQNNATYMYSVRNERIMVTLLSPKSELKNINSLPTI